MSHLVSIKTQVRDPIAIQLACERLKLPAAVHGTAKLFRSQATGWQVKLPDWHYPVVCETDSGELKYDNYNGDWGDQIQLDRFLQAYAVEMVKLQARRQGQTAIERPLADGSIRLQIAVTA